MQSNRLLIATAVLEAPTGVVLMTLPAVAAQLLLGTTLDAPGLVVARIAGAALFAIGVLCWVVRNERNDVTVRGILIALLFYNVAALVVFAHAGLGLQLTGLGVWPAVTLHAALAAWCIACLATDRYEVSQTNGIREFH
jgi:hypothetical protein